MKEVSQCLGKNNKQTGGEGNWFSQGDHVKTLIVINFFENVSAVRNEIQFEAA